MVEVERISFLGITLLNLLWPISLIIYLQFEEWGEGEREVYRKWEKRGWEVEEIGENFAVFHNSKSIKIWKPLRKGGGGGEGTGSKMYGKREVQIPLFPPPPHWGEMGNWSFMELKGFIMFNKIFKSAIQIKRIHVRRYTTWPLPRLLLPGWWGHWGMCWCGWIHCSCINLWTGRRGS